MPLGYTRDQFLGLLRENCTGREKDTGWYYSGHFGDCLHASCIRHSHRQRYTFTCNRTYAAAGPQLYENISLFHPCNCQPHTVATRCFCRYTDRASRENTYNPLSILFLFICTVLMSSDSMGNKIHIIQQQHPSVPLSSCSQPLDRFVILDDSHGRGTALRVMDGPGGDYTPGECKAPTLPCKKSPPPSPDQTCLHLFTRHYFALRWNWSSTHWLCWRKLIPEGIRSVFTDEGH